MALNCVMDESIVCVSDQGFIFFLSIIAGISWQELKRRARERGSHLFSK